MPFFFFFSHFPRCSIVGKGALDDGRTVVFVLSYLPLLPSTCCCAFFSFFFFFREGIMDS